MSGIIALLAAVYGTSMVVAAAGGVAWACSDKFRYMIRGEYPTS